MVILKRNCRFKLNRYIIIRWNTGVKKGRTYNMSSNHRLYIYEGYLLILSANFVWSYLNSYENIAIINVSIIFAIFQTMTWNSFFDKKSLNVNLFPCKLRNIYNVVWKIHETTIFSSKTPSIHNPMMRV